MGRLHLANDSRDQSIATTFRLNEARGRGPAKSVKTVYARADSVFY